MIRIICKWMIKVVETISSVSITLLASFTFYEVCMRELFRKPTIWTNEISSYLLVWVGVLGMVYAYDKGTHVSVDFIFRHLNARMQRFFNIITTLFVLTFALCLCIYGYKYWWIAFSNGWRHFGMLDIPMSFTRIALPIAGLFLVFQVSIALYDYIKLVEK